MSRSDNRDKFLSLIAATGQTSITIKEIVTICDANGMKVPQWFTKEEENRLGRGLYKVPNTIVAPASTAQVNLTAQVLQMPVQSPAPSTMQKITNLVTDMEQMNLVPTLYSNYVPFGNFEDLNRIIGSNKFYPVFITGQSGNGKTMSVEQVCAKLKRKFVCISMTPETDESDLLGNYVLMNGEMVWRDGPVTVAARQGAVLCIDEIDYGAQNLSCLQRVLEGKPFLLKKKNEVIAPAAGFTIIATANTKGKGSDDGRFMFTNVLNEAFLERFPITFEQGWAPNTVEKKIVKKELASEGRADDEFADNLVVWADAVRKTFEDGGCDEVISTRRLVHIAKAYGIFGDRLKAIQYCLNRFDEDTKASFLDLYTKVDASVSMANTVPEVTATAPSYKGDEVPF
jgi:hypothetical protein